MSYKLVLAPLRGITGYLFRNTFSCHFGAFDEFMAPFITTVSGMSASLSHYRDIIPQNNTGIRLVPQLIGKNAGDFIRMANFIHDEFGYKTVNWNLGCPFPKITNKMRGSGLIPHPDFVQKFLDQVIADTKCAVSVKTRLGLRDPDELIRLIPYLNGFPLKEIIVHPRLSGQLYEGDIDYSRYGTILNESKNPVSYNGDITDRNIFNKLAARFPATRSWMIGRGAVSNPFIAGMIKGSGLTGKNPERLIFDFHNDLFKRYKAVLHGPAHLLGKMKELWIYLSLSFRDGEKILKKIRKTKKTLDYQALIENFFEKDAKWRESA